MTEILNTLPNLLSGLKNTLYIFTITLILSIPLGILVSLGRLAKPLFIQRFFQLYIYVMRGTPLLLQLVFIYYGLPSIGITFDRFSASILAMVLNYGAYFGEIFRGGIQSIDKGQSEASKVLGISKFNHFRYIVLPQVIKRTITSVSNEVITLVKDTALVSVLGIAELQRAARTAVNTQASLIPFFIAGAIYLIVSTILTKILEKIEKRYNYYE
jgi:polar amino acid transport system permease protein